MVKTNLELINKSQSFIKSFMIQFFFILTTVIFNFCLADETQWTCDTCKKILEGKIPPHNHRYRTFVYALELLSERKALTIVETGTARYGLSNCLGDGCSTMIFGEWAKNHAAEFYSVDIDPESIMNAENDLGDLKTFIHLICNDSITFLTNFSRPIDFLYLDSFDLDLNDPLPSQEHHLKEIIAAYPWLHSNSIVMIDDCDFPCGGKGKLAIEYLLDKGWEIIASGYQVILAQKQKI